MGCLRVLASPRQWMTSWAAGVSTAQVVGPTHPTSNPAVRSTFQTVLTDQSAAGIQAAPRSTARLPI